MDAPEFRKGRSPSKRSTGGISFSMACAVQEKQGFRYVFIDEVTLLSDFIEGAALFSDIFASSGMKIVLSGTDSLGFLFAEDDGGYHFAGDSHGQAK